MTPDAAGTKTSEYRYTPFGGVWVAWGSLPTNRKFTGYPKEDAIGGIDFAQARFYDSVIGRFLSADSIVPNPADPQSLNRFSYTRNSPLNRVDPTGHCDGQSGGASCSGESYYGPNFSFDEALSMLHDFGLGPNGLKAQVANGTLAPVEALARLSEIALLYLKGDPNSYMLAMTILLLAPRSLFPDALGQDFLPVGADAHLTPAGDWDPRLHDGTSNQAFHFWFYVATAYWGDVPNVMGQFLDLIHDPPGFWNQSNAFAARFGKNFVTDGEATWQDSNLSSAGFSFGQKMRAGLITNPSEWIRSNLKSSPNSWPYTASMQTEPIRVPVRMWPPSGQR